MRQIKFRGKRLDGFGYAYGDLTHVEHERGTRSYVGGYLVGEVAQLIGVDANGAEVYEGDTIIRVIGSKPEKTFPMYASFSDYDAIRDGELILIKQED